MTAILALPLLLLLATAPLRAQSATLRSADERRLPSSIVDGNSPGFWTRGILNVFTSTGDPIGMSGATLFDLQMDTPPAVFPSTHYPLWIESAWAESDDVIYAWYHHEPNSAGVCGNRKLTAPMIGALRSTDGGRSFEDLGIVLAASEPPDCRAENGFFAGGHGDFSVILDRQGRYFYFLFGNYGGPAARQGVSIARMRFDDRDAPIGAVFKFSDGLWEQPGLGGTVSPIFPARTSWSSSRADSFWGPAVHWNTYLQRFVIVMNRACCGENWPQEGIYLSFGLDLADPSTWSAPRKILDDSDIGFAPGYYPQIWGLGEGESDTLAGQTARLFVKGVSRWEVNFSLESPPQPEPPRYQHPPPDTLVPFIAGSRRPF
ncbi:MAG: hypothetical protein SFV54_19820 [Bryobacteraceae bacterium]|nr:hypothetical protein [Bryobacteraceae bacterium]